jgi:tetratricopeptide (TPR) repeat protein
VIINNTNLSRRLIGAIIGIVSLILIVVSFKSLIGQYYKRSSLVNYRSALPKQAIKDIKTALFFDNNPDYYQKIGVYLLKENKPKLAIPYLQKAEELFVFHLPSLFNLAESYRVTGDLDKQRIILEKILNLDNNNIKASSLLVRMLYIQKEYQKATIEYKRTKQNFNYFKDRLGFGKYHANLAETALLVGDYKFFGHIYDDLIVQDPTAVNYVVYGVVEFQRTGNKAKAKELFNKAIEIDQTIDIPKEIRNDLGL